MIYTAVSNDQLFISYNFFPFFHVWEVYAVVFSCSLLPSLKLSKQFFCEMLQFAHLPQVERLLEIFTSNFEYSDVRNKVEHLHPFIVLEGLDGSGNALHAHVN
jgi:hypothetical protein